MKIAIMALMKMAIMASMNELLLITLITIEF